MDQPVTRRDRGAVACLTLSSPTTYNALSQAMIDALAAALHQVGDDPAIRVVVLAAEGKAFSAGHDLRALQDMQRDGDRGQERMRDLFDRCAALMQLIPALPQPVIAQVQGVATAAGCQLVASCDLAVAADNVRFGVNGVAVGLFCTTPMVALTRVVPPKAAFEMLTTGDFIPAARAAELGLINHVVPAEALEARVMAMADSIAAKPAAVIRMGKAAFHAQRGLPLPQAYAAAGEVMCRNLALPETAEGIAAFLEKRAPDWP